MTTNISYYTWTYMSSCMMTTNISVIHESVFVIIRDDI